MPYSILTLAAELVDDFDVTLIDMRSDHNWQDIIKDAINEGNLLCVGLSSMTGYQLKYALDVARFVKQTRADMKVIWGGVHVSTLPQESLKSDLVDIVVRGEGEKTMLELCKALESGTDLRGLEGISYKDGIKVVNNLSRPYMDINLMKPMPWHLLKMDRYFMQKQLTPNTRRELDLGETSRGCPYQCTFCYNTTKNCSSSWRPMSPERTVKMIKDAIETFGIDGYWFRDDNYFVDLRRLDKILALLEEEGIDLPWYCPGIRMDTVNRIPQDTFEKLKRSNILRIRPGVESGSNSTLKLIKKNMKREEIIQANLRLKEFQIPVEYSYIIGFPTETLGDMYETVSLIHQLRKDNPYVVSQNINLFSPYPGTELWGTCLRMVFEAPTSIEQWSEYHHLNMNFGDYSKTMTNVMKSMSELSYYTAGIVYENFPTYLKVLSYPLRKWCDYRFKNNLFDMRADLEAVKFVRDKVFF